jgi:arylsulfatase A-like enzyme
MVRAMDESVKNITATYAKLGLLQDTLIILTGDNGGIPFVFRFASWPFVCA